MNEDYLVKEIMNNNFVNIYRKCMWTELSDASNNFCLHTDLLHH